MSRVNNQTPAGASAVPPSSPLTHFTHPHELHPFSLYSPQTVCSGCKLQSSGIMYTCIPCNFALHQSCAKLPQRITHPSHGGCTLTLLTTASYPGGIFNCDGCSCRGDGWSYHCTRCEYDLHVSCASKPLKIRHQAHRCCELELTFKNPYMNSNGFSCDICRKIGSKQWLYRCNSCEFDVHLDCVTAPQPTLQHHHSMPAATSLHYNQLSAPPPQQPHLMHSESTGGIGNPSQFPGQFNAGHGYGSVPANQPMVMQNGLGSNLMMAAIQGLVEGASQGVGQAVAQEFIGGGGGGSGGGSAYDGGGGDVSSY